MRRLPFSPLVFLLLLGGCDAYGGADPSDGDGGAATFTITGRSPGPGTSGVSVSAFVEVTFNTLIDTASVDAEAVLLNGAAIGTPQVDGKKLRFIPSGSLLPGTSYAISLAPTLAGQNGHPLGASPVWGFKTAGSPPPPDTLPPHGPRPR